MSRNIKYRVWENSENRMILWDSIYKHIERVGGAIAFYFADDQEMIMMQFTELLDKNKKEIYEGDIMKIELPAGGFWGTANFKKIGVVRYEPDYGGYIIEWEYSRHQHYKSLDCDIAFGGEVLGNIYEHTHLIKNEDRN